MLILLFAQKYETSVKHINNTRTRALVINVVSNFGLDCPVLCSPEELIGDEDA
jgi:hypothetical protein